jgi:uncharacterized protein with von Willebrand factor type A (vWA) domain
VSSTPGIVWLQRIANHFERSVWLNPEKPAYWEADTCRIIRRLFPMFHLSIDGMSDAVRTLVGSRQAVQERR